jgi:hypothetical protein
MAKLHEILAVDANLKGQAQKCRTELQSTFEKKRHLFTQKLVTFTPLAEGVPAETREQSDIQSTVKKEVTWLSNIVTKAIDAAYAIDIANTTAKADIVLEDGTVIAKDVPATALLQLEKRVKEVSEFVHSIPTLDPAKGFEMDSTREAGIYKAREVLKPSTQKIQEPLVLAPATDKHPAQVQLVSKDVKIGTVQELEWSSLITPALKAELLERSESLFRAVTQARSRANDTEIDTTTYKIGKKMLEFVFQPLSS